MVTELRTIIANVNATTVQVSSSTGEILAASSLLVRSAGEQAQQIDHTGLDRGALDHARQNIFRSDTGPNPDPPVKPCGD